MVLRATEGASGAAPDKAPGEAAADPERVRILDAAEHLFYAHGLQQVGMDQVRGEAAVSLKRLYREFPSKDQLIEAYLLRRDARWLTALRTAVARQPAAREGIRAAFDWLGEWFSEPGFRGCAFTNSFGELGADSATVAAVAAAHKAEFRAVFTDLVDRLADEGTTGPLEPALGEQLYLLAEGAITAAAVGGDPGSARTARSAADTLLAAALASSAAAPQPEPTEGSGAGVSTGVGAGLGTDRPPGTGLSRVVPTRARSIGARLAGFTPFRGRRPRG